MPKKKVGQRGMTVNTYEVLRRAVEEGVAYGYMRAHKYVDSPTEEAMRHEVEQGVMNSISEYFDFEDVHG